jgi:hypothetical protein
MNNFFYHACVLLLKLSHSFFVCVCVCEREREREVEGGRELGLFSDVGRSVLFAIYVYPGSRFPLFSVQGGMYWFSWQFFILFNSVWSDSDAYTQ